MTRLLFLALLSFPAMAAITTKKVPYELDKTKFEGALVFDDAKAITAKVLALHGADDPFVPQEEVAGFEAEMRAAKVDWQLVAFGNAVHSYTDVEANTPGKAQYNPVVAARAYALMDSFFAEALKP